MATFSKDLSVTSSGVYTLEMNLVPTGSTVTPVNDIQTWLHCANIWNKNYTTLAQVLADTSTLNSLIQSNNAADYMARSTDWAANPGLVPKMTSNTTPSGEAISSGAYGTANANYKAFDGVEGINSCFEPANTNLNTWVGYAFPSATTVRKVYFGFGHGANSGTFGFKIQGTNNVNGTWTDLDSFSGTYVGNNAFSHITRTFNNSTAYKYYRVIKVSQTQTVYGYTDVIQFYKYAECITENQTAMTYIGANNYCATKLLSNATWCAAICNSAYFDKVLTTKVPTMTSNNTPSGECSANRSDYQPYLAFDGNGSTYWWANVVNYAGYWIQYQFANAVKIKIVEIDSSSMLSTGSVWEVRGSNDGTTFTTIPGSSWSPSAADNRRVFSENNTAYKYYRFYCTSGSGGSSLTISTMQFYGRA